MVKCKRGSLSSNTPCLWRNKSEYFSLRGVIKSYKDNWLSQLTRKTVSEENRTCCEPCAWIEAHQTEEYVMNGGTSWFSHRCQRYVKFCYFTTNKIWRWLHSKKLMYIFLIHFDAFEDVCVSSLSRSRRSSNSLHSSHQPFQLFQRNTSYLRTLYTSY